MMSGGRSLMVWISWPATWLRILCSLKSGMTMSWQNRPLFTASSALHEALSLSERGGPRRHGEIVLGEGRAVHHRAVHAVEHLVENPFAGKHHAHRHMAAGERF